MALTNIVAFKKRHGPLRHQSGEGRETLIGKAPPLQFQHPKEIKVIPSKKDEKKRKDIVSGFDDNALQASLAMK
jgi:hypothetical protein